MTSSVRRRVSSHRLVGRHDELDAVLGWARALHAREPSAVLVSGRAGMGKSRLVEEVGRRLAAERTRVVVGGCLPLEAGVPPYVAISAALTEVVPADAPVTKVSSAHRIRRARIYSYVHFSIDRQHPPTDRRRKVMATMRGVVLPGDSTVKHVEVDVPEPGHGQVLLQMKASSICGTDIRAIYREHLGSGPKAYRGVIPGHEPCGQLVAVGPGCRRLSVGDRVVVYHIAGCGVCQECRHGYMIGCTSPLRAAHGWQCDGGHTEFLLAEEATCILLPDELSYVGGALTPHLHPLAHGATAVTRSLTRRPARSRLITAPAQPTARGQRQCQSTAASS